VRTLALGQRHIETVVDALPGLGGDADEVSFVTLSQFRRQVQFPESLTDLLARLVHFLRCTVHRGRVADALDEVLDGLFKLGKVFGGDGR
jgi:hypothetical protein